MTKKKIIFEPGCFDHFDGSQEELDELVSGITEMFENMSEADLIAQSRALDFDELLDEDPEFAKALLDQLQNVQSPKKLQ